ncbi:hypothetical protein FOZ63_019419, partial [Perkinsus olseni]
PPEALLSVAGKMSHISVSSFTPNNNATPLASYPSCRANECVLNNNNNWSPAGNQSICAPPSSIGFETGEGLCNQISEKCFTQDAQWKRAVEEVRRAVQKSVARGCAASPSELVADLLREGASELYGFWSLSERSLMPMIDLIMGNSKTVPCREATMMRLRSYDGKAVVPLTTSEAGPLPSWSPSFITRQ